jgi:hypothetical protein
MTPATIEKIEDLVAGDSVKPAAECAALGIIFQPLGRPGDGPQNILHQIGRVGILQAASPGKTEDQRPIQLGELPPGIDVFRITQSRNQTRPSDGSRTHGRFPDQTGRAREML